MAAGDIPPDVLDLLGFSPRGDSPVVKSPDAGIPAIVTRGELRALLGVSETRSRDLAARVWVKVGRDRYDARASIAAHVADMGMEAKRSATPELDAEKLRLAREQADKLALANAKARGDLLDAADVAREWASVLRDVRAAVLAAPSRIGSRLPHLSAHDVGEIGRELAAALSDLAEGKADDRD